VIYADSSVLVAHLLSEDRAPGPDFWSESLVTSRLAEYEIWTRVHARKLERSHGAAVGALLGRLALVELSPEVLARATEPFPAPVRILDALHLATVEFLRRRDPGVRLATYDDRMLAAARKMRIAIAKP